MRLKSLERLCMAGVGVTIQAAARTGIIRADVATGDTAAAFTGGGGFELSVCAREQLVQQKRVHAMGLKLLNRNIRVSKRSVRVTY